MQSLEIARVHFSSLHCSIYFSRSSSFCVHVQGEFKQRCHGERRRSCKLLFSVLHQTPHESGNVGAPILHNSQGIKKATTELFFKLFFLVDKFYVHMKSPSVNPRRDEHARPWGRVLLWSVDSLWLCSTVNCLSKLFFFFSTLKLRKLVSPESSCLCTLSLTERRHSLTLTNCFCGWKSWKSADSLLQPWIRVLHFVLCGDGGKRPADGVNLVRVLVLVSAVRQAVAQSHETLSETLVDGVTPSGWRCSHRTRAQHWKAEHKLPSAHS